MQQRDNPDLAQLSSLTCPNETRAIKSQNAKQRKKTNQRLIHTRFIRFNAQPARQSGSHCAFRRSELRTDSFPRARGDEEGGAVGDAAPAAGAGGVGVGVALPGGLSRWRC